MCNFAWDEAKASSNWTKHGVRFDDALTVFGDRFAMTFFDEAHTQIEDRYLTLGFAASGRLLLVCHTYRPGAIRLISARLASRRERKVYANARS